MSGGESVDKAITTCNRITHTSSNPMVMVVSHDITNQQTDEITTGLWVIMAPSNPRDPIIGMY